MKYSLLLACQIFVANVALGADAPAAEAALETPAAEPSASTTEATAPAVNSGSGMESICKLSNNTRRVKMDMNEQKCQVLYYKETEKPGTEDQLWQYNHEFDKCKKSYSDFVEKLRGMSWTCS